MKSFNLFARFVVFTLAVTAAFPAGASARPMPHPFALQDEKRKLPPVNWIRSRTIDMKHVAIDLKFNWEKDQALGVTTVTLAPFNDTDRVVLDAASMTINSVTNAEGRDLRFSYDGVKDGDNLLIWLGKTAKGGEDVTIKIDYATNYVNTADTDTAIGSFGKGLRFIKPSADDPNKPRQIWSQGETEFNRYWFPSYDTPNDFRTSELRATVVKPFFVVSNGKLIETKENADNTRTFYWKMDQPYTNYLTSIVVAETEPVVLNFEGIPVYNYGYKNETKEVAATVKNLPANMKFFSELTGIKYPYAKYSQAFVEDFGGGMENISATTMIEEMIHDERELLDVDHEGLQAHELAHQWFGDYVTCRDWGQIWLNESFATYLQAMWTEKLKGRDDFLYSDVYNNQQQVLNTWFEGNRHPIVTKYFANKDAMFDSYAYPGGAAVLHMLRKHLGDKLFNASLKKYLTTNAHQPVSTEDFRIAIEEASGQSMDWFFDQWLYKMGHPVFDVTQSYDVASKKLTLNVKQTQKIDLNNEFPQTEFFQAYVDVAIDKRVERVWIKPQAENVFTFDAAAKPKIVNFDHEGALLKELKFEKTTDELLYQMANDSDVLGRHWAMGELEQRLGTPGDKERILTAFFTASEKDLFWRLRRAAFAAVSRIIRPPTLPGQESVALKLYANTEAVILRLAMDKESLIRADAIEMLGATEDAKHVSLFLAALNDRSYGVIDQAAAALAATEDARAYDALAKLAVTPSWKGRVQVAGLSGLADLGDKRAFDMAYKIATDVKAPLNVRTAAGTTVGMTGKGDPRAFPLVFDRFKKAIDSGNFGLLEASVESIIRLADPRGQEAFEILKVKFKDNPQAMQFIAGLEAEFKAGLKP